MSMQYVNCQISVNLLYVDIIIQTFTTVCVGSMVPVQGGGSSESTGDSSSSDSDSSSDESVLFDDGLDEHLVGGEEDRAKLSNMTDIEREQEMYMR